MATVRCGSSSAIGSTNRKLRLSAIDFGEPPDQDRSSSFLFSNRLERRDFSEWTTVGFGSYFVGQCKPPSGPNKTIAVV
jgi:hypothetical protein